MSSMNATPASPAPVNPYDRERSPENPSDLPDIPMYLTLISAAPNQIVPKGALYNSVSLPSLDAAAHHWIREQLGLGYIYVMAGSETTHQDVPSRVVTVTREEYEAVLVAVDRETLGTGVDSHRAA